METAAVDQDGIKAGLAGALDVGTGLVADVHGLVRRHGHTLQAGFKDGGGGFLADFAPGDAELQVLVDPDLAGELFHVPAQVGEDCQAVAASFEFGQHGPGLLKLNQLLGNRDGHVPDLLGHAQGNGDSRLFQYDLLVAGEEGIAVGGVALAQRHPVVFLVEIEVGDGVTPGQAFRRDPYAEVLASGVLDLGQGRPESHQSVVEIEEYRVDHWVRGAPRLARVANGPGRTPPIIAQPD